MEQPYTPDPFKNFTPRQNPVIAPKAASAPAVDLSALTESDIARFDSMSADALRDLFKRLYSVFGGDAVALALKTPEDLAEAFKLKLAIGGMRQQDMFKALPIMREWFDRSLGKAAQSVAVTVKDDAFSKMSTDKLIALERELSRLTGQDALVIAPLPKSLSDD
jgi:hypothetical protein